MQSWTPMNHQEWLPCWVLQLHVTHVLIWTHSAKMSLVVSVGRQHGSTTIADADVSTRFAQHATQRCRRREPTLKHIVKPSAILEILAKIKGRDKHICDSTCKYWKFPHLDRACVLSEVFSVRKGEMCTEHHPNENLTDGGMQWTTNRLHHRRKPWVPLSQACCAVCTTTERHSAASDTMTGGYWAVFR